MRFTVFNSANSEALRSNRIIQLKEGKGDELWMASEQGDILRFRAGRFTNVAQPCGTGAGGEGVVTLFVDPAGDPWIGAPNGLWTVRHDSLLRVGAGIIDARVSAILGRRDGTLWVGTDHAGIVRVDKDGRVEKLPTDAALSSDFITILSEDASGTLWIAGLNGLWSWREQLQTVGGTRAPFRVEWVAQLPSTNAVYAVAGGSVFRVDGDSATRVPIEARRLGFRLWTDATALWTVDGTDVLRGGHKVFTLPPRRHVSTVLFDRKGSLWLGSDAGGLHRLKPALKTWAGAARRLLQTDGGMCMELRRRMAHPRARGAPS